MDHVVMVSDNNMLLMCRYFCYYSSFPIWVLISAKKDRKPREVLPRRSLGRFGVSGETQRGGEAKMHKIEKNVLLTDSREARVLSTGGLEAAGISGRE